MSKKKYVNLPPSLGPAHCPPFITHERLIHEPQHGSVRYAVESLITLAIWLGLAIVTFVYVGGKPALAHGGWLALGMHFLQQIGQIALLYLLVLAAAAAFMAVWATVNKYLDTNHHAEASALEERRVMRAFEVSRTMFERLRSTNVVTIFHDEMGEIESIRVGDQIPQNERGLSQLPPESFMPTSWNSILWEDGAQQRIANLR